MRKAGESAEAGRQRVATLAAAAEVGVAAVLADFVDEAAARYGEHPPGRLYPASALS